MHTYGIEMNGKIRARKKMHLIRLVYFEDRNQKSFITTRRFVNSQNSPMKGRMRQNRTSFKRGLLHLKNSFFLYF